MNTTTSLPSVEKIEHFWKWFSAVHPQYKDVIDAQTAISQMDEQVLTFGMLTWEIGPTETGMYFTLSPNGDPELLTITRRVMYEAPMIPGWTFHFARPAQQWDFQLEIYNADMDVVRLDTREWHYLLFLNDNDRVELVFTPLKKQTLTQNPEYFMTAIRQALIKEIGEEALIRLIDDIEIVDQFDTEDMADVTSFPSLKKRLQSRLKLL